MNLASPPSNFPRSRWGGWKYRDSRPFLKVRVFVPQAPVYGISQARMLEWVAIPFSRGTNWCPTEELICFFSVWGCGNQEGAGRGRVGVERKLLMRVGDCSFPPANIFPVPSPIQPHGRV